MRDRRAGMNHYTVTVLRCTQIMRIILNDSIKSQEYILNGETKRQNICKNKKYVWGSTKPETGIVSVPT